MIELERQFRKARSIPLTPLVDVLCCLLIFFMLSTSFVRTQAMELSLPSQGAPQGGKTVHVYISNNGEMFLENQTVDEKSLHHLLRERLFAEPDSHVLVEVANKVSVQALVRVLDRIYLSGGRNVSIDNWNIPAQYCRFNGIFATACALYAFFPVK
jgi:biopolymer transport protein ExbD